MDFSLLKDFIEYEQLFSTICPAILIEEKEESERANNAVVQKIFVQDPLLQKC